MHIRAMTSTARVRGAIPAEGAMALLRRFEGDRASGRLRFEGSAVSGEVWLVGGNPLDDEAQLEAMEQLLQLEKGDFQFTPALPPLPMSRGDDRAREGRLGVHAVADLMAYCEECGLTGSLSVRRRQREARLGYTRGELVDIRVDGEAQDDLLAVFEWESGEFRIELADERPAEDDSWAIRPEQLSAEAAPLAVEMSLDQIVEEGRSRRPSNLPPPQLKSDRKPRKDATVKIVFLGAPEPIAPPSTTSSEAPPAPPEPQPSAETYEDPQVGFVAGTFATVAWVVVWASLILGGLAVIPHIVLAP
jgi:hypothetical protein